MLTPEERARQNEYEGGPCVPDGFQLFVDDWSLYCPHDDWARKGRGQAELEETLAAAREHYASAHPAEPNQDLGENG